MHVGGNEIQAAGCVGEGEGGEAEACVDGEKKRGWSVRAMGSEWGRRVKGRILRGTRVALCQQPRLAKLSRWSRERRSVSYLPPTDPNSPPLASAGRACHFRIN